VTGPLPEPTGLNGYQLRLPTFEGPLDVLLRLIERSQLAITEVSLVALTSQFLEYLQQLQDVPPATIAEFSAVGSRLVLLKSRSLLPRSDASEDDDGADDLVQQLIEYRLVKEAAQQLADRDAAGGGAFARGNGGVVAPAPNAPPRLAKHEAGSLARALRRRLSVLPSPRDVLPLRRVISLREMIERILTVLPERGPARFSRVAATCADRHELLTAFLGVLVLIRRQVITAEQTDLFGDITIRWSAAEQIARREPVSLSAADD
jgi:segregation and condensation protein A